MKPCTRIFRPRNTKAGQSTASVMLENGNSGGPIAKKVLAILMPKGSMAQQSSIATVLR